MKKYLFTIIIAAAVISTPNAQTSLSLGNVTYITQSDTVIVPVEVLDFSDVGAISLTVKYDTSGLNYYGIQKNFSEGVFLANNTNNGEIKISWFNLTPLKLSSNILLNLIFIKPAGNSIVQFDTSLCEIADSSGSVIKVAFKSGSVTQKILPVSLAGKVWLDINGNGILDTGENGVQWVTVNLFKGGGTWLSWQLTDSLGNFDFKDYKLNDTASATVLKPGNYYVSFILADNNKIFTFSNEGVGSNPKINSHAKIVSDTAAVTGDINLSSGENYGYANAGLKLKNATSVNGSLTKINDNSVPKEFELKQNYPNPFNPTTIIEFNVPKSEMLQLNVYNILGQRIATLVDGEISAGIHSVTFDAANLNSGIYIYHLSGQGVNITRKMILTK